MAIAPVSDTSEFEQIVGGADWSGYFMWAGGMFTKVMSLEVVVKFDHFHECVLIC